MLGIGIRAEDFQLTGVPAGSKIPESLSFLKGEFSIDPRDIRLLLRLFDCGGGGRNRLGKTGFLRRELASEGLQFIPRAVDARRDFGKLAMEQGRVEFDQHVALFHMPTYPEM